jgi:hypothetical protein
MIRLATPLSLVLCAALGLGLFKVKYEVQSLEENLLKIHRQTAQDQEQLHVLSAEWGYLTQPVRLGGLASRHLPLQPLTSAQLGSFDTLPLKADAAAMASNDKDVPIAKVLQAMQVAAQAPAAVLPARQALASARPGDDE